MAQQSARAAGKVSAEVTKADQIDGGQPHSNANEHDDSLGGLLWNADEFGENEVLSIAETLERAKTDPNVYVSPARRILNAIGEPIKVDTRQSDDQERRVFGGQTIRRYKPFEEFYDVESVVDAIVGVLKRDASGILVLRGPVGSGKTELTEVLEELNEQEPVYMLRCKKTGERSPFGDTVLSLFTNKDRIKKVCQTYGIPESAFSKNQPSPWVSKRLKNANGNAAEAFEVEKVHPSCNFQIAYDKIDPKDPKSADIASFVGEPDLTRVGEEDPLNPDGATLRKGDPDAYTSGTLSKSNRGILHWPEGFRNNPALMNTLLEGVTTGYFTGAAGGLFPMRQVIVITSNDSVWKKFSQENDSDAARNRITVVDVPYSLRMSEEKKIYEKILKRFPQAEMPMGPKTLDLLAEFSVVTRLKDGKDGSLKSYDRRLRAKVMNGEIPDGPKEKIPERRELIRKQHPDEGMDGFSIRDATERVLLETFNARSVHGYEEADGILLLETLRSYIAKADETVISSDQKETYLAYVKDIESDYRKWLEKEVNQAIIDADDTECQREFDRYLAYAEASLEKENLIDESGEPIELETIEKYLQAMEKAAGITNGPEFRRTATHGVDRELKRIGKFNEGKAPEDQKPVVVRWDTFEPLAKVIRAQHELDQGKKRHIFKAKNADDLRTEDDRTQFERFHANMERKGFTTPSMRQRALHYLNFTNG